MRWRAVEEDSWGFTEGPVQFDRIPARLTGVLVRPRFALFKKRCDDGYTVWMQRYWELGLWPYEAEIIPPNDGEMYHCDEKYTVSSREGALARWQLWRREYDEQQAAYYREYSCLYKDNRKRAWRGLRDIEFA